MEAAKAEKPGNGELQAELDEWMARYEEAEERRRAEALLAHEEEGWTVVQRHKVCVRVCGGGEGVCVCVGGWVGGWGGGGMLSEVRVEQQQGVVRGGHW